MGCSQVKYFERIILKISKCGIPKWGIPKKGICGFVKLSRESCKLTGGSGQIRSATKLPPFVSRLPPKCYHTKRKTGLRLRLEDLLEYFRFVNLPGRYKNPFIFFFFPPLSKRFRQITQPHPLSSMSPVPVSHVHLNQGFRNSSRTFLAQFGLDSNKKLFSGKPPPLISGSVPK